MRKITFTKMVELIFSQVESVPSPPPQTYKDKLFIFQLLFSIRKTNAVSVYVPV